MQQEVKQMKQVLKKTCTKVQPGLSSLKPKSGGGKTNVGQKKSPNSKKKDLFA